MTEIYYKGRENSIKPPFFIQCSNCGSHNVDIIAFEHWDLEIKCKKCGSYLDVGRYNETSYSGEETKVAFIMEN